MSLKFRLNLFLSALFILVICLASLALLRNARENAGDEPAAAHRLAAALLDDLATPQGPPVISTTTAANLSSLRHLRLAVADRGRSELAGGPPRAPAWFEGLFSWPEIEPLRVQIENRAPARLHATPLDEIAEVWDDAKAAGAYALALLVLLNAGGWLILRRELRPLEQVSRALGEVKKGELSVRLPSFKLPEVAALADGFNRMAEALAQSRETNRKLTRTLIGVQEEERRQLSRELHDEFGQHLTAARAEAYAIERQPGASDRVRASAKAIEASCLQMHKQLRGMLDRLRPEALDALGLEAALLDLVCDFRKRFPDTEWTFSADLSAKLAQDLEIAIYRCIQESFTNIARHAKASRVNANVTQDDDQLSVSIEDDGTGFDSSAVTMGWGLTGMRERIEGLGGDLRISAGDKGRGTVVYAMLPI